MGPRTLPVVLGNLLHINDHVTQVKNFIRCHSADLYLNGEQLSPAGPYPITQYWSLTLENRSQNGQEWLRNTLIKSDNSNQNDPWFGH